MALSPCRSQVSPNNRNRSFSFTALNSRNFFYQEILSIEGNAMIRSFSCSQVFSKKKTGETVESTQVQISNFISPIKVLPRSNVVSSQKCLSAPKKLGIKNGESKPVKAKLALKFSEPKKINKCRMYSIKKFLSFILTLIKQNMKLLAMLVVTVSFIYEGIQKFNYCNQTWQTGKLIQELQHSVYGQDEALSKVEYILQEFNSDDTSMVIAFTGSVGIGKTFVASKIYDHFPWKNKVHVFNDDFLFANYQFRCGAGLIIIDGMDASQTQGSINLINNIVRSNQKYLVVLIFQSVSEYEENQNFEMLNTSGIKFTIVPFKNLSEIHIRQCFEAELKRQGKGIFSSKLNTLVADQMLYCNISRSYPGCKNVFHLISQIP